MLFRSAASASILTSVMMIKQHMKNKEDVPIYYPILFSAGWLLLGWSLSDRVMGLAASALVIGSMLFVLPWQRKQGIVDGPGMPMLVMAWIIIIYLNSHLSHSKIQLPNWFPNLQPK